MYQYPRQLKLDSETEDELKRYLDSEITKHFAERQGHKDDLLRWQKDYWAKPSQERKKFPYLGASNIIIPLSAIAIESIVSKIVTTVFALDQFVELELADVFDDIDRDVENYLDNELLIGCKVHGLVTDTSLEFTKFGTCIGKSGFCKEVKTAVRMVGDGETEEEFDVVTQGSTLDAVPLANFLMPFSETDPQKSKWVGEEHTCSDHEIYLNEQSGLFIEGSYESLKRWVVIGQQNVSSQDYKNAIDKLQNIEPVWPSNLTWHEIWLSYDVDKSKKQKEIVIYYHEPSRTILSLRYNWFKDLRRPYRKGNYFPVEHRWLGIGVCKQNEQFQRAVTTQHRQRLDNATIANMRMLKINKMTNYGPNEPIFPGKMWFVDNKDDIETIQFGEVYPSSYNNESSIVQYSQQRTGANELTLGMPQVGTPGTATSDLTRVQEGSKKFDFTFRNFKVFLRELSLDTVLNINQFGFRDVTMLNLNPKGDLVKQFFQLPFSFLKNEQVMKLNLAGQNQNKILNRQNWMQLAQIMQQYYTGMIQLVQTTNPQMLPVIAQKAMSAVTEAFIQILDTYDVRNIDRLVIQQLITNGMPVQNQNGGQNGGNTPMGGDPSSGAGNVQQNPQNSQPVVNGPSTTLNSPS